MAFLNSPIVLFLVVYALLLRFAFRLTLSGIGLALGGVALSAVISYAFFLSGLSHQSPDSEIKAGLLKAGAVVLAVACIAPFVARRSHTRARSETHAADSA